MLEHEILGERIEQALAAALPGRREAFGEDFAEDIPAPSTVAKAATPMHVIVHDVPDHDIVGVELNCDWDPEHGLGILFDGGTALGACTADASFVGWMARQAAERRYDFSYWRAG